MAKLPLSSRDRKRLVEEINNLPSWRDGGTVGEKSVLRGANLPENYIGNLLLSGSPRVDSLNVVANLEALGRLHSRPTYYALGSLVEFVLENTPAQEGKLFLAHLLYHYQLIVAPEALEDLRREYLVMVQPQPDQYPDLKWNMDQPTFVWQGSADIVDLEAVWRSRAPFHDVVFLEKGAKAAQSVCLVETESQVGTGFLISPNLVITNQHVVHTEEEATATRLHFGYRIDISGKTGPVETYQVRRVVRQSDVQKLDYTILELEVADDRAVPPHLTLVAQELKPNEAVYIIQHPRGEPQKVVLQDNWVTYVAPEYRRVQYLTNTRKGSSGSPVFNQRWEVVALHHSGFPFPTPSDSPSVAGNEGIPMKAILPEIKHLLA